MCIDAYAVAAPTSTAQDLRGHNSHITRNDCTLSWHEVWISPPRINAWPPSKSTKGTQDDLGARPNDLDMACRMSGPRADAITFLHPTIA